MLSCEVKINDHRIAQVEIVRKTRGPDGGLPRENQLCRYRWEASVGQRGERERLYARGELDHPYSYAQGAALGLLVLVIEAAQRQLGLPMVEEAHG